MVGQQSVHSNKMFSMLWMLYGFCTKLAAHMELHNVLVLMFFPLGSSVSALCKGVGMLFGWSANVIYPPTHKATKRIFSRIKDSSIILIMRMFPCRRVLQRVTQTSHHRFKHLGLMTADSSVTNRANQSILLRMTTLCALPKKCVESSVLIVIADKTLAT